MDICGFNDLGISLYTRKRRTDNKRLTPECLIATYLLLKSTTDTPQIVHDLNRLGLSNHNKSNAVLAHFIQRMRNI